MERCAGLAPSVGHAFLFILFLTITTLSKPINAETSIDINSVTTMGVVLFNLPICCHPRLSVSTITNVVMSFFQYCCFRLKQLLFTMKLSKRVSTNHADSSNPSFLSTKSNRGVVVRTCASCSSRFVLSD